jgi:peptidyl-prolyl cis-trans isomerase SurA
MKILLGLLTAMAVAVPGLAQDQHLVDEVVAKVNSEVITRSQYLQAVGDAERDIRQSVGDQAEAERAWQMFKPHVLDSMIDDILLAQKGQEIGIDVEAQINQQFSRLARENNMSITEFEEAMRKSGVDPTEARARLRERLMRESVLNQEVFGEVYRALTDKEKREYYEAHKDRFMQPGELKLSTEIEAKAREVVAQAKAGTPFKDLVRKHGDPTRASYANSGSLGSFKSAEELAANLASAVASLKTGELTEPIRVPDGVLVLYVDERREAAARPFEDVQQDVSLAIVYERGKDAQLAYLKKLRAEAYIKVTPGYESQIAAALNSEKKP